MTINNIRIFLEVYNTLSITQTAKNLYITQPAVSRAIKNLETEYGICLFERIGKKLFPTEDGIIFYKKTYKIVAEINDLHQSFSHNEHKKTIRIGAAIMIGNFLIPQITKAFELNYPDIEIKVIIASASVLTSMLQKNELDLALIEDDNLDNSFRYISFYEDVMVPIVAMNHPLTQKKAVTLKDLCKYPFLMREPNSSTRIYVDKILASNGIFVEPKWESSSTLAILNGVACNIGVSILPFDFSKEQIDNKRIVTFNLNKPLPTRTCFIVLHKDKYISEALQALMDFIQSKRWLEP